MLGSLTHSMSGFSSKAFSARVAATYVKKTFSSGSLACACKGVGGGVSRRTIIIPSPQTCEG